jgi:hypothetical protein
MEWRGLSKSVNAEGLKGYHGGGGIMMTNLQAATHRVKSVAPNTG